MKRQSILSILLLLLTLFICCGCGASGKSAEPQSAAVTTEETAKQVPEEAALAEEAAAVTEEAAAEEAAAPMEEEIIANQKASNVANAEDVIGIFEGLEDNHTAIFSFDGAEIAFYFEDPAVQNVLYEAVIGSPYTLSYSFDDSLGLDVIYKISE